MGEALTSRAHLLEQQIAAPIRFSSRTVRVRRGTGVASTRSWRRMLRSTLALGSAVQRPPRRLPAIDSTRLARPWSSSKDSMTPERSRFWSRILDTTPMGIRMRTHWPCGARLRATMKIVDTLAEQSLLEETKPPVPPECREFHYLLSTPFRYGAPYPTGSRFRPAGFHARCVLCVDSGGDSRRRAGVSPAAVLRGFSGDAVAASGGRVLRLPCEVQDDGRARSDRAAAQQRRGALEASRRPPRLSGSRRARSRSRACRHQVRVRAHAGRSEPRAADVPRVRVAPACHAADLAPALRRARRSGHMRRSRGEDGVRPSCVCRRSADCDARLGVREEVALQRFGVRSSGFFVPVRCSSFRFDEPGTPNVNPERRTPNEERRTTNREPCQN